MRRRNLIHTLAFGALSPIAACSSAERPSTSQGGGGGRQPPRPSSGSATTVTSTSATPAGSTTAQPEPPKSGSTEPCLEPREQPTREHSEDTASKPLISLQVAWAPEQVVGFPWYAAWKIRATGADLYMLSYNSETYVSGAFGLRVKAAKTKRIIHERKAVAPPSIKPNDAPEPSFPLLLDQVREGVVDLASSRHAVESPIPRGEYDVDVTFAASYGSSDAIAAPQRSVRFRSPTSDEQKLLDKVQPLLEGGNRWVEACRSLREKESVSVQPTHPLALPLLFSTPYDELAKLSESVFSGWPEHLAPYVRVVYLGWLDAKGDRKKAVEEAQKLRIDHPGLDWKIDEAQLGCSP